MVRVLVAASSPAIELLRHTLGSLPFVSVIQLAQGAREVVDIVMVESLDVAIIDETLLMDSWGLYDRLGQLPVPIILVIAKPGVESTRRALAIHAIDAITQDSISDVLPALLTSFNKSPGDTEFFHRTIGIYSAKGGVGKTTLAVNLAWSLARLGQRPTALVDLDLQFGDVGPMVHDRPDVTIRELVEGSPLGILEDKLSRSLIAVDSLPLNLLLAPFDPQYADLVESRHIKEILTQLRSSHVFTICDLAAALSDQNLAAIDLMDIVVLVATPEVITLRNVARSLAVLQTLYPDPGKLRIAVNRAGTGVDAEQIGEILSVPVSYWMPSGGVAPVRSANAGKPLVAVDPANPLAISIENVAKMLLEEFEGASRRTTRKDVL